jgi:hypothetical protein
MVDFPRVPVVETFRANGEGRFAARNPAKRQIPGRCRLDQQLEHSLRIRAVGSKGNNKKSGAAALTKTAAPQVALPYLDYSVPE